jgi:hypothetical protein
LPILIWKLPPPYPAKGPEGKKIPSGIMLPTARNDTVIGTAVPGGRVLLLSV